MFFGYNFPAYETPQMTDAQQKSIDLHPEPAGFTPVVLVCHCGKSARLDLRAFEYRGIGINRRLVPVVSTMVVVAFWAIHAQCEVPGPGHRPSSVSRRVKDHGQR